MMTQPVRWGVEKDQSVNNGWSRVEAVTAALPPVVCPPCGAASGRRPGTVRFLTAPGHQDRGRTVLCQRGDSMIAFFHGRARIASTER